MSMEQIGTMPYRKRADQLYVMLITNRNGSRWILPKGHPEEDMTRREVALMETFEEAGIMGRIHPNVYRKCTIKRNGLPIRMRVYPLKISKILRNWPEDEFRKRRILTLEAALESVDDKALRRCMQKLADLVLTNP